MLNKIGEEIKHIMHQSFETPGPPPSGISGAFTFYACESQWTPRSLGQKWMVNSPAPICPTYKVLPFKRQLVARDDI